MEINYKTAKLINQIQSDANSVVMWSNKGLLGLALGDEDAYDALQNKIEMLKNARLSFTCLGYRMDDVLTILDEAEKQLEAEILAERVKEDASENHDADREPTEAEAVL